MEPVSPLVARKTWRTVEPCHGFIYFTVEAAEAYAELGVTGPMGYFASRAAALGAASAELVVATFYNFNPSLVRSVIPAAWDITTPEAMLEARLARGRRWVAPRAGRRGGLTRDGSCRRAGAHRRRARL